jgi:hypothetical protein
VPSQAHGREPRARRRGTARTGCNPRVCGRGTSSLSEECRRWRPSPAVEGNLDHQFVTRLGVDDIVPSVAGSYDDLRVGATKFSPWGIAVTVEQPSRAIDLMSDRKKQARAAAIRQVRGAVASGAKTSPVAFERMLAGG